MTASECDARVASEGDYGLATSREVVELPLLVPRGYLLELEHLADAEGITVGLFLRRMIREHLTRNPGPCSDVGIRPGTGSRD